jgi:hypothetical protein
MTCGEFGIAVAASDEFFGKVAEAPWSAIGFAKAQRRLMLVLLRILAMRKCFSFISRDVPSFLLKQAASGSVPQSRDQFLAGVTLRECRRPTKSGTDLTIRN